MTIYEIIKAAISVKQAAKHYGLNVNRNGMACCPFHNDRHPSLKLNEDYFSSIIFRLEKTPPNNSFLPYVQAHVYSFCMG